MVQVEGSTGDARSGPLSGLNVLDLSCQAAAGLSGRLLASLGASVTHPVGSTPTESPYHLEAWPNGLVQSIRQAAYSHGKTLWPGQWKTDRGRAALMHHCAAADVLLEPEGDSSFGYEAVQQFPRLISCSITPYGRTGPWREAPGTDLCVQALMGLLESTGGVGEPPTRPGVPLGDRAAALFGTIAILAAIRQRDCFGHGARLDVAAIDALIVCDHVLLPMAFAGQSTRRDGNHHPTASPWNVYPTLDGSVAICTLGDRQWIACLEMVGREEHVLSPHFRSVGDRKRHEDEVDCILAEWCVRLTTDDILARCAARHIPAGRVATIAQISERYGAALRERGIIRTLSIDHRQIALPIVPFSGWEPKISGITFPAPTTDPGLQFGPLRGLRVTELGQYTTGPLCGRLLGGLGAEIVKVEPPTGDAMRPWHPRGGDDSWLFQLNNAGKRSIAVDAKTAEGNALLRRLIGASDILISNFAPGVMQRLTLSDESIRSLNPTIVNCEMAGFHSSTDLAQNSASDTVIQAESGIMSITGWPQGGPARIGISVCDVFGAVASTLAILAALVDRRGRGARLELAMFDAALWLTEIRWLFEATNLTDNNSRFGNAHPVLPINGVYSASDGLVALGVETPRQVQALIAFLGTGGGIDPHRIERRVRRWIANRPQDEAVLHLQEAGIPAAPVLTLGEAIHHPQIKERSMVVRAGGLEKDGVNITNPAVGYGASLTHVPHGLPGHIGAQTDVVLRTILGIGHDEIVRLHQSGVIGRAWSVNNRPT